MISRSQKVRLGIFLSVAIFLLLLSIALITGSQLLKQKATYYIRYQDISLTGLELGSAVKYRGIRIGRIEDIYIDEEDITSIIVEITVDPKVPIKEDTEAIVTLIGITGLKMIELQGGTNESAKLQPENYIKAGFSIVESITGKAEVIAQKLEMILNNLATFTEPGRRDQFFRLVDNTSETLGSFRTLLDTNQTHLNNIISNLENFTSQLDTFMVNSNHTLTDIMRVTQSNKLENTVGNLEKISADLAEANLGDVINKMALAIDQTNRTFTHLDLTIMKSRHDILSSTELLKESLEYFNEFTRLISENPSLLLRSSPQQEIRER
ncbi:MCE family protein [candidate division KSB1 bacterium]|nr:MCE family protein [candidate division KSB1 bacterium]MBL7094070.1 MCE family protein [candidate division KSB1 bacterium]